MCRVMFRIGFNVIAGVSLCLFLVIFFAPLALSAQFSAKSCQPIRTGEKFTFEIDSKGKCLVFVPEHSGNYAFNWEMAQTSGGETWIKVEHFLIVEIYDAGKSLVKTNKASKYDIYKGSYNKGNTVALMQGGNPKDSPVYYNPLRDDLTAGTKYYIRLLLPAGETKLNFLQKKVMGDNVRIVRKGSLSIAYQGGMSQDKSISDTSKRQNKTENNQRKAPDSSSPEAASARIKEALPGSARNLAVIENNGSQNGKKGGTLFWWPRKDIFPDDVIGVRVESGVYDYIAIHKRNKNGVWKLIYKGNKTSFDYDSVFKPALADSNVTHLVFSVNGANERYTGQKCQVTLFKKKKIASNTDNPINSGSTAADLSNSPRAQVKTAGKAAVGQTAGQHGMKGRNPVIDQITAESLAQRLNIYGLKAKAGPREKSPYVLVQFTGRKAAFLLTACSKNRECRVIKALSAFKIKADDTVIQQFNQNHRYAVLYHSDPGRVRVESSLELSGGVSPETVIGFVERHRSSSAAAAKYLGLKARPSDLDAWQSYQHSTRSGSAIAGASVLTPVEKKQPGNDTVTAGAKDAVSYLALDSPVKGAVELTSAFGDSGNPDKTILIISAADETNMAISRLGLLVRVEQGPANYLAKEFWFKNFDPVIPDMAYAVLPCGQNLITGIKIIELIKVDSTGINPKIGKEHIKIVDDQTSFLTLALKGK